MKSKVRGKLILISCIYYSANAISVPLTLKQDALINFGRAVQGDGPTVVAAGTARSPNNGSFTVEGEPNRSYSIILPSSPVPLTQVGGSATLALTGFHSFPAGQGNLDASGKQTLLIGATRESLIRSQPPGEYSGEFFITVTY